MPEGLIAALEACEGAVPAPPFCKRCGNYHRPDFDCAAALRSRAAGERE